MCKIVVMTQTECYFDIIIAKLADPGAFEPDDEADVVFDDMVDDYDDEDDAIDAVSVAVSVESVSYPELCTVHVWL